MVDIYSKKMTFKNYIIKKGTHRSGFYPNLHFGLVNLKYEILFTESCLYKFGDVDDFDINKLFGISFGYHHNNSVRFGWNVEGGYIAIHAYYYVNKKRYMNKITTIPINTIYTFEINAYDYYCDLKISDMSSKIIGQIKTVKSKTTKWGYKLFPYFGGNKYAPHDVVIKMSKA